MGEYKTMKVISIIGVITAALVAVLGLSGHLSSFIGGIGWMLVAVGWARAFKEAARDERVFNKVMAIAKEEIEKSKEEENE
jgi:hypothetical protein